MLHFKNFGLLKSPTVRRNYTELTGINNGEIVYTLLNVLSIIITLKKPIKKGLNSNNKSRLASVTRFPYQNDNLSRQRKSYTRFSLRPQVVLHFLVVISFDMLESM